MPLPGTGEANGMRYEALWVILGIMAVLLNGALAFLVYAIWSFRTKRLDDATDKLVGAAKELQVSSMKARESVAQITPERFRGIVDEIHAIHELAEDLNRRLSQAEERDVALQHQLAATFQEMERLHHGSREEMRRTTDVSIRSSQEFLSQAKEVVQLQNFVVSNLHDLRGQLSAVEGRGQMERTTDLVASFQNTQISPPSEPGGSRERVHFSVYAPQSVRPAGKFPLSVFAFLARQRKEATRLASLGGAMSAIGGAGPIAVGRGEELTISVNIDGCQVEPTSQPLWWCGEIASVSFAVLVREDAKAGQQLGRVNVQRLGVPILQLHFTLTVAQDERPPAVLAGRERQIRSVFASYSWEDREEVLKWAQGARDVGVDVYVDVIKLRAGANWEEEIWREIPSRDLLALFWSRPASKSEWVEKEWRCALDTHGLDSIHPVPLVDPREVPPPAALKPLRHFDDPMRIHISYESEYRQRLVREADEATKSKPR